ncbi:MAG TPA: RidA family protein [Hymenobacter sp.]|jgi:enamine deaminase RidA (YjgF/YER057c/UK114 family)
MKTATRLLPTVLLALASLTASAQSTAKKMTKEYINPPTLPKSTPGYSQAVAVRGGRTIYVAGQVGANLQGELVGRGDLRTQLAQAFQNLGAALTAAGAKPQDVVKMNYYVVNYSPNMLPIIREERNRFFTSSDNPPVSTLVGVSSLYQEGVLVEMEAVAVTE